MSDCIIGLEKLFKKVLIKLGYRLYELPEIPLWVYKQLYGKKAIKERRFYNVGAGIFKHPAWTNIDNFGKHCIDIKWNLTENSSMPLEDNSAYIIYTSHTIEHISDENAQNLFNEAFRVLKREGGFRVITPDIDLFYRAYKNNDKNFFYWFKDKKTAVVNKGGSIQQIFLKYFTTQLSLFYKDMSTIKISDTEFDQLFKRKSYEDALNYCTSKCDINIQKKHHEDHINWWNKKKLIKMLKKAGFKKVYVSAYGQSAIPVLCDTHYFDNTCPKISLYVEAIK